jgi:hypothetical protein
VGLAAYRSLDRLLDLQCDIMTIGHYAASALIFSLVAWMACAQPSVGSTG